MDITFFIVLCVLAANQKKSLFLFSPLNSIEIVCAIKKTCGFAEGQKKNQVEIKIIFWRFFSIAFQSVISKKNLPKCSNLEAIL